MSDSAEPLPRRSLPGGLPKRCAQTSRRTLIGTLLAAASLRAMTGPSLSQSSKPALTVAAGADVLAASRFAGLMGKRVGLVTNQTGRVGGEHLVDVMRAASGFELAAIFAPEHGFRGAAEAGAAVKDGVDAKSGVPIFSLYGASRKPTQAMLRKVDILLFDIQDVGARFYTYISTMGLAMQAAAAARLPFLVLDRPNPLGGQYVSGFVLEPGLRSFVGQYPIPIVHGMTVGELARMIKGERWLDGLDGLDLDVTAMQGWRRSMRWPQTGRGWVTTSPNIPTFDAALVYPGIGMVGELDVNEGRGTPTPFGMFGAPWLDAKRMAAQLNTLSLPGVTFERVAFTPRSIPDVATRPRFAGTRINGVRIVVNDAGTVEPLEVGIHVLAGLVREARARNVPNLFPNMKMFHAIAGTRRLHQMLSADSRGAAIVAAWQDEVARFKDQRARYLLY
jgi:uncharacterized protein YbbC (DUF1343 family)